MNTIKEIPLWWQSFKDIIINNQLYIDKTKELLKIINSWNNYYYISRPRRWGKSLNIETMKEIFLGNKELFKGLYAYDNYKDWDKSYPVVVISFSWFNVEYNNLSQYLKEKTNIYINDKKYKINDFLGDKPLQNIQDLLENIYKKTNKKIVVLIDEYDSPFTKNLNNETEFNKIKLFFTNFYSAIKDLNEIIRFFYLSGLTKVWQTNLFSGLNNLLNITFSTEHYKIIWYTEEEIKKYFNDYLPIILKKMKVNEDQLFKSIKRKYDWFFFWEENDRLYNPWSINNFFKEWNLISFWAETGTSSIIADFFSNLTIEKYYDFLTQIINKKVALSRSWLIINDFDDLSFQSLLLQSWYLTYDNQKDFKIKIANEETKEALYLSLIHFLKKKNKNLPDFSSTLLSIKDWIINRDKKMIEEWLNFLKEIVDSPTDWINKNPEWFFKGIFLVLLTFAWFDDIRKEEGHDWWKTDIVILHEDNFYIIEAKIGKNTIPAIEQIDKQYISAYQRKKWTKIWLSWDKDGDKKIHIEMADFNLS